MPSKTFGSEKLSQVYPLFTRNLGSHFVEDFAPFVVQPSCLKIEVERVVRALGRPWTQFCPVQVPLLMKL
jgi:hypothetical protein